MNYTVLRDFHLLLNHCSDTGFEISTFTIQLSLMSHWEYCFSHADKHAYLQLPVKIGYRMEGAKGPEDELRPKTVTEFQARWTGCKVFTLLLRFSQFTKRTGTRYISMVFFK